MAEPDCADMTITRARPDNKGVFRYTASSPERMTEEEIALYCKYDWSMEKEALRKEMGKQLETRNKHQKGVP